MYRDYPYYSDSYIEYKVRDDFCWHLEQRDTWKFGKKEYQQNREDFYKVIRIFKDEYRALDYYQSSQDYMDDKIGEVAVQFYLDAKDCLIHGHMCVGKARAWREEDYEDDEYILIHVSIPFFYTRCPKEDKRLQELNKMLTKKYICDGVYQYELSKEFKNER